MGEFRTELAETVFKIKYAHPGAETWYDLAGVLVERVCDGLINNDIKKEIKSPTRSTEDSLL